MIASEILAGFGVIIGSTIGSAVVAARNTKKAVSGAKEGAAEGAASTLNGTKEAVQRIEYSLLRHVTDTGDRFDRIERRAANRDAKTAALARAVDRFACVTDTRKAAKALADKVRRAPVKKKPRPR